MAVPLPPVLKNLAPRVQLLDRSFDFRNLTLLSRASPRASLARAPASPSSSPLPSSVPSSVSSGFPSAVPRFPGRFREAVPDFLTLLCEGHGLWVDPSVKASLRRWADLWHERTLDSMHPEEIQSYLANLAQKGHTGAGIEKEKALLRAFFRWARRCGWTDGDPTSGLTHTRILPDRPVVAWSVAEQRRLLAACCGRFLVPASAAGGRSCAPGRLASRKALIVPAYLYPLVLLGLRTGLRLGDLLNLEWRHVFLREPRIRIPASEFRTLRDIDVPFDVDVLSFLLKMLRLARRLPALPQRVLDVVGLPSWKGRPDELQILRTFRATRKKAGIRPGDFNSLRLTYLGNCARAGLPLEAALTLCDWEGDPEAVAKLFSRQGEGESNG